MCVHSTTLTPFAMCKYSQCAIRYVQLSLLSLSYNKCLSYNKSVPLEIVTLHASSALIYILVSTYLIRNKSVSMKCPCRLVRLMSCTATHIVVSSGNVHVLLSMHAPPAGSCVSTCEVDLPHRHDLAGFRT